MRVFLGALLVGAQVLVGACAPEGQEGQAQSPELSAGKVEVPAAAAAAVPAASSQLMAIPDDPDALKRLEAMGYTIHGDHLHAPGVTDCPKMGDGPVM